MVWGMIRQAAIIRAEGEAEAASLISKAIAEFGSALIEIRRIDVSPFCNYYSASSSSCYCNRNPFNPRRFAVASVALMFVPCHHSILIYPSAHRLPEKLQILSPSLAM